MCVAIYCDAKHTLTEEELRRGWKANPDGGGFAYIATDGSLSIFRSMELANFLRAYDEASDRNPSSPFAVHMRIATSGTIAKRNCHPFRQDRATAWIHNGILPTKPIGKRSDTAVFVEDYLPQLGSVWMDNPYLTSIVEEYCVGSKLVGLTTNPKAEERAYIINESDGYWSGSAWYSNRSCEARSEATALSFWSQSEEQLAQLGCLLCESIQVVAVDRDRPLICMDCSSCQGCGDDYEDCECFKASPTLKLYGLTDGQYLERQ